MTNRHIAYSYGGGVRVGADRERGPELAARLRRPTPIWMSKFGKYKGLFADGGAFDIPASIDGGLAWDAVRPGR